MTPRRNLIRALKLIHLKAPIGSDIEKIAEAALMGSPPPDTLPMGEMKWTPLPKTDKRDTCNCPYIYRCGAGKCER